MAGRAFHIHEPSSPLSSVPPSSPVNDTASDSGLSEPPESSPEPEQSFAKRPAYPSPAKRRKSYPSPSSSRRSSAKTTPAPEDMPSPPSSNDDNPQPRKKVRLADSKERPTEYLDLSGDLNEEDRPQMERLLKVLHKKRKIVVIAGAGISVSAGIPDFRSATGLFNTLKKDHKLKSSGKDLFDASVYQDDTSTSTFHDMVRTLSQQTKSARPTAFHQLLATLAHEGRLMRLYTQNVDGIDTSLPPLNTQAPLPKKAPWPKTIQVHGGLDHMVCSKCNTLSPFEAEIFSGPVPPSCPSCVELDEARVVAEKRSHGIGRLRPRMVLYNEHNPDDEAIGSCATTDIRLRPDAVIVAGTTLKVPGVRRIAREMCKTVRDRRDGVSIWINNDPEPLGKDLEDAWDLVIKGPCDEVARHANMRRWDDPMEYKEVSEADVSKVKDSIKVEVVVPAGTPKKPGVFRNAGHLTPGQSPRMAPRTMVQQEPSTPSKKRKAPTQTILSCNFAAQAPSKTAAKPKKKAVAKGKGKKDVKKDTPAINSLLKASKPSTRPAAKVLDKTSNPTSTTIALVPIQPKSDSYSESIQVQKIPIPATPRRRTRLTQLKPEFANIMAPLSDADRRNNYSPKRPEVEPFTPSRSSVKDHASGCTSGATTPSKQIMEDTEFALARSSTNNSLPPTAHSERNRIIRPNSSPKDMAKILC